MTYMKRFNQFLSALPLLGILLVSCDQREFELPPLFAPVYTDTATMSIADFKTKYATVVAEEITDTIVLSGIIVANDVSGNFYKEFTIMDSTGGLKVAINQGDLYTEFRVGQQVFIECEGLWVGKYGGYMQLGGSYNSGIGQMTWAVAQTHIFKNGWPNPDHELLTPEVIDINVVAAEANLGKLITLENVQFATGGTEICAAVASDGSTQTVSKTLNSSLGSGSITVRLSSASDFANKTLPAGNGDLTGILSVYSGTYQFTPRDSLDFAFEGFGSGYVSHGLGLSEDPWTVDYALTQQTAGKTGWVVGYIVGVVKSSINASNPIDGNDDISWAAPFTIDNTVVIATDSIETDWTKCLVVSLPALSTLRDSVNLMDHPGNIGKKLAVTGDLETYLGAGGVTVANGTTSEFWLGKPVIVEAGEGTVTKPYNVTQAIANQSTSGSYYWVKGYILGSIVSTSGAVTDTYVSTNIALGSNPAGSSYVSVQLPIGEVRDAINLVSNPANLGKEVTLYGTLESYCTVPGIKGVSNYILDGVMGDSVDTSMETLLFEPFTSSLNTFTGYSVTGTQVWTYQSSYGATMTGYASPSRYDNQDWLISSAYDLTDYNQAKLTFSHAINYGLVADMPVNQTLWVSTNYTSGDPTLVTWTQVTIPTYPSGTGWTFVSSSAISLPASVLGRSNVRFAFKYLSTTSVAATWEVDNITLQAK
jgi:hypothetical protein